MKIVKPTKSSSSGMDGYTDLPSVVRPSFADTLRFPDDITQLSAQNVSELLGKYTALQAFAIFEQAGLTIKELDKDREEALLRATIIGERPNIQHLDRWRRDDILTIDPRWLALQDRSRRISQRKVAVSAYVAIYEKYSMALSRELSRKTSSGDGQRHSSFSYPRHH